MNFEIFFKAVNLAYYLYAHALDLGISNSYN